MKKYFSGQARIPPDAREASCHIWLIRSAKAIFVGAVCLLAYIFIKFALSPFVPLVVGFSVASLASRACDMLSRGEKKNAWLLRVLFVLLFWCLLFLLLWLLGDRIISEVSDMLALLKLNGSQLVSAWEGLGEMLDDLAARLSQGASGIGRLLGDSDSLGANLKSIFGSIAKRIIEAVILALGSLLSSAPSLLLSVLICMIFSIYVAKDYAKICEYARLTVLRLAGERFLAGVGRVRVGVCGYGKAYLKIFFITLAELYIGLMLMQIRFAFIIALLISLLDLMPFFGVGTVLLPWSLLTIAGGDKRGGAALLALFVVVTVIRQILQPRIVGKGLGIHPAASLAAIYVGYRIFGVWGMLFSPIVVLIVKISIEATVGGNTG